MHFLCFAFLKLRKLETFFRSKIFISEWKEEADLTTSNNPNEERGMKKVFWNGEKHGWDREIYIKLFMPKRNFTQKKTPPTLRSSFSLELHSHCY